MDPQLQDKHAAGAKQAWLPSLILAAVMVVGVLLVIGFVLASWNYQSTFLLVAAIYVITVIIILVSAAVAKKVGPRDLILAAVALVGVSLVVGFLWTSWYYGSTFLMEVGIYVAVAITIVLILAGYFYKWTGFGDYIYTSPEGGGVRGKTLWDWLQLIIIPITLLLGGYLINSYQQEREISLNQKRNEEDRKIAEDLTQETLLQTYLDRMGNLLIGNELSPEPKPETKQVARVWTITVMRRVNGERKGIALQFLRESSLIRSNDPVVVLLDADLSGANLRGADLRVANLRRTRLIKANLSWALLIGADISLADLSEADLNQAHASGANLSGTNLSGANLSGADLSGANLRGTQYTRETVWPDGFDPVQAGAILVNR